MPSKCRAERHFQPFMQVLLNIVDALFICYAIDRDRSAVTKVEVHEIFSLVSAAA